MLKKALPLLFFSLFMMGSYQADAQWFGRKKKDKKDDVEQKEDYRSKDESETKEQNPSERRDRPQETQNQERNTRPTGLIIDEKELTEPTRRVKRGTFEAIEDQSQKVIVPKDRGSVNWSDQYIEAKGESVIDTERFSNAAQARAMAIRGATVVAQRNLLEIINGVNVTSETKVVDMMTESDYIYTRVDGLVKGAQMVGEPQEKYGMMEVTLRIDLYKSNGLANAVYDGIPRSKEGFVPNTVADLPESMQEDIIETMAFNLGGKTFDPALFPVILDEEGNILLDLSNVYDPKKGNFPKILNTGRSIFEELGFKEGIDIIDLVEAGPGQFKVNSKQAKKINWSKIGKIFSTVGKIALLFI